MDEKVTPKDYDRWDGKVGIEIIKKGGKPEDETSANKSNKS